MTAVVYLTPNKTGEEMGGTDAKEPAIYGSFERVWGLDGSDRSLARVHLPFVN